jgi:4-amino-4-deoxychorismate lyase
MDATTLVNGQPSNTLDVSDRGLAYGDGVFETIALNQGQVQLWQGHRQRLITGLITLGIVIDEASAHTLVNSIVDDIQAAYALYGHPQGVIKVTVTRGSGGRGYAAENVSLPTRVISIFPWPSARDHLSCEGVQVQVCQHRWSHNTALAGVKHLNRLDQVMARSEWSDTNIHEGIMLNQDGLVISGVMSNLFIEIDGALITPKLDQCGINGTMAQLVRTIAKQCSINVVQQKVTLELLLNADAAFMTNSLNGIWPITALMPYTHGSPKCNTTRWPISALTNTLQEALAQRLSEQLAIGELC